MIPLEDMLQNLSEQLDGHRFQHSINVMESAEQLARHYGADPDKALVAGLLHDCGKHVSGTHLEEILLDAKYVPDPIERAHPKLLHGLCGEVIAQRLYGVMDREILDAIRWHTTGRSGMAVLEKIVFVADYVEVNRNFPEVGRLREAAWRGLDEAVVLCADVTIAHVVRRGSLLHPFTVQTRNEILLRREAGER